MDGINGDRCGGKHGAAQGSSMMYVILLVTLLAVLSGGYMAAVRYNMKSAMNSRSYMEAQLSARTIHRSFCEAVSSGDSEAMNLLWRCFEEDCSRVQEEFDAMMDEEDGDQEMSPEGGGEENREKEETDRLEVEDGDAVGEDERWERYLYHALGDKEYVMCGSSSSEDGDSPNVDITLTALPLKASAHVHTRVEWGGYQISMMADIVFDDRDGAVMTIRKPRGRTKGEMGERRIYLNGNGVYRYYEDPS